MFTADRPRTVTLPPLVLGGLRPLHRQMVRSNVPTASFDHATSGGVFEVCLLAGTHGPELSVRSRTHGLAFTMAMTTHFRVAATLSGDVFTRLCRILTPGEDASVDTVVDFLQEVVAQAPSVLARTHACAA